jgi:hypothetical protein
MKRLYALLLSLCLGTAATAGWADGLPAYYPADFPRTGNVDRVNLREGAIVINDTLYSIDANTPVHTLQTRFATASDLAKNTRVGITFSTTATGRRRVEEVWVLPDVLHSESP